MRFYIVIFLVCLAVCTVIAVAESPQAPASGPPVSAAATPIARDAQGQLLRILTPAAGQQLKVNYIDVSYELVNPGASGGEPNFVLQLDAQDPVRTGQTTFTFTGLTPGQHSLTVQLVDANGTPLNGGRASVVFFVSSPQPSSSQPAHSPFGASALPLISVIGFGALVGGLISAIRIRK